MTVADVAECCRRCLELDLSVTMNVAGPDVFTLRQIGTLMSEIVGENAVFEVMPDQPAPNYVGDTTLLRRTLDWAPATTLAEGLRDWMQPRSYALAS
jgi:nucleoside-diphosphate-sugar epimerase